MDEILESGYQAWMSETQMEGSTMEGRYFGLVVSGGTGRKHDTGGVCLSWAWWTAGVCEIVSPGK